MKTTHFYSVGQLDLDELWRRVGRQPPGPIIRVPVEQRRPKRKPRRWWAR